jgi:hypothetical protein
MFGGHHVFLSSFSRKCLVVARCFSVEIFEKPLTIAKSFLVQIFEKCFALARCFQA